VALNTIKQTNTMKLSLTTDCIAKQKEKNENEGEKKNDFNIDVS
jgi:hypothetical protein